MRTYNFDTPLAGKEAADEYYMREALVLAKQAYEQDEIPVGALIVCHDRIIGKGYNLTETLKDVTAHAEMQTITAAANYLGGKYLHDCILYVTLEPCIMCAGALRWSQIKKVVYGAPDPKKGSAEYGTLYHPKTEIIGNVMEKECAALITSFFRNKR